MTNGKYAAEFFAGIGLVRMALERANWKVVFANDIDPAKKEMYQANFGDDDFVLDDIRNIRANAIPPVSLATASFPCIDLSLAGNRNGLNGRHSSAYWEFHRILSDLGARRPAKVLIENVVGLLTSRDGADLREILESLAGLGYSCDVVMVDAVHLVPQSRPRLFILGWLDAPATPPTLVPPHEARPPRLMEFIRRNDDLPWRLTPLPPLPRRRKSLDAIVERLDETASEWWDEDRKAHLYRQMSPAHKRLLRQLMSGRELAFATVYKRVRPAGCRAELRADGVAGCLRTPRGGSSKQFLIQAGVGQWRVRNMTAREYARLQGVPDSYRISVPENQALFGFGDAVCVPAVEWVIREAMDHN
jgi:DNA (cytosine-5)-methyltransferase 1